MYCFLHVNVIHQFFIYRNIYKLSDFGTAKPLNDNDFFVSLVGTDEYLVSFLYRYHIFVENFK